MNRVVVTGMSGITAFGDNWTSISEQLKLGNNAVRFMPEWDQCSGLRTSLAAPVDYTFPKNHTLK